MAQVKFKRIENSVDINNIPIVDGQLIYTKDGKQYIDYETDRVNINKTDNEEIILWENENPTENISTMTINLSSNNYDELIWIYKITKDSDILLSEISIKGYGTRLIGQWGSTPIYRNITRVDDTTYSVSECSYGTTSVFSSNVIPLYVIGKNTGLFGE